ncbi:MAG: glutamyl-tRNA reductase [Myxococcota bacterium]
MQRVEKEYSFPQQSVQTVRVTPGVREVDAEMEQLVLLGVSYRRGGVKAIEAWQAFFQKHCDWWNALGVREYVYVLTCNRSDVLFVLPKHIHLSSFLETLEGRFAQPGYVYQGEAALEQLARIASSLDSMNPGEDQILSQVKQAFAQAEKEKHVGKLLHFAFHTALQVGKQLRRALPLAPMNTSLFSLARPLMDADMKSGHALHTPHVVVLGAGQMGELAVRALLGSSSYRVTWVNRSVEKLVQKRRGLPSHADCKLVSLQSFWEHPPQDAHALVCATAQAGLIRDLHLQKMPALRSIVDLGLPRNVELTSAHAKVSLWDVESLQQVGAKRRQQLKERLFEAECMLLDTLEQAIRAWLERLLGPDMQWIRQHYLGAFGESSAEHSKATRRQALTMAHAVMDGVRQVSRTHGIDAARTFLTAMKQVSPTHVQGR